MPSLLRKSVRRRRRLGGRRKGGNILTKAKDWLKKTGVISGLTSAIPVIGPAISSAVRSYGYGRRRRVRVGVRHRRGAGWLDNLKRSAERKFGNLIESGIKKTHNLLFIIIIF